MGFMLSPASGVELHSWSLPSKPLVTAVPWNNRKTYFVFYSTGYESVPLKLSMNFTVLPFYCSSYLNSCLIELFIAGAQAAQGSDCWRGGDWTSFLRCVEDFFWLPEVDRQIPIVDSRDVVVLVVRVLDILVKTGVFQFPFVSFIAIFVISFFF